MNFLSRLKERFFAPAPLTKEQLDARKRRIPLLRAICGIVAIAVIAVVALTVVAVTHGAALAAVPFIAKAIAPIAAYVSSNIPAAVGLAVTAAAVIQETAVPAIRNRPGLFMKAREEYRLWSTKRSIPKGNAEPVTWEKSDPDTWSISNIDSGQSSDYTRPRSSSISSTESEGPLSGDDIYDDSIQVHFGLPASKKRNSQSFIQETLGSASPDSGIVDSPAETPPRKKGGLTLSGGSTDSARKLDLTTEKAVGNRPKAVI